MNPSILQVVTDTQRRGAEVFAVRLGTALTERGRVVRTVALTGSGGPEDIPIARMGRRPLGAPALSALRREARNATLVVGHGSKTLPAGVMATTGTKARFIYRNIGDPMYWAAHGLRRARVGFLLRQACAVVARWPGAATAMTSRHGVPGWKIRVIPTGVPAELFPQVDAGARATARQRLGRGSDEPLVLYLGALSAEKDVGTAIRAMASVPGAHLLVVGDGPERSALEALAGDVGAGRVHFLGPTSEPASMMAAADVVVLPSRTEGMPGVLIEAGMSGLPVVATDVGAVREVVVDGTTGHLVASGDPGAVAEALREVLAAPGSMGERAREHCVTRFDMNVIAAAWDELFSELDGAAGR